MIQAITTPPPNRRRVRSALLSVYDKRGLAEFAAHLSKLGIQLLSSGGTAMHLREAGLEIVDVASLTGFPEILGGRVKTLHPLIHGAILARRGHGPDDADVEAHGITPIDLVVINLYPFEETVARADVTDAIAAENIDIGGPAMIRAAAKNYAYVGVVTDPADYKTVGNELHSTDGCLILSTRSQLAARAFQRTAAYDTAIHRYFASDTQEVLPETIDISVGMDAVMRYGENPHQQAAFYGETEKLFESLHGKPLSFNNFLDLSAALALIDEFADTDPTVAILKHTNPCGVAVADSLAAAYDGALATDRQSPFGGVVVVNCPLTLDIATRIDRVFTEIIIAPAFAADALAFLKQKKNRRLVRQLAPHHSLPLLDTRSLLGGMLVQERDPVLPQGRVGFKCVTKRQPTAEEWNDLEFAWRVAKHVKSNAIVYARNRCTLGIGAGQMSRVDASEIAVMKSQKSRLSLDGSVIASDAFFPFADGLVAAGKAGAAAAIQPGGSVRDAEVIEAADKHGMAMVFTGKRHFLH